MASYVESALINNERIVYRGQISLWSLAPLIIIGLLTIQFGGIGLLFIIAAIIRYNTFEAAITTKRVIAKFGLIGRKTIEINIGKVESIQVDQSIIGRMFDYGSIILSGAGNPQAPIPGISDPMNFRRRFMETQEKAN